jgi:flagellar protein FliS
MFIMEYGDYSKTYYNAYQQASDTVDEVQQIVMLYEGAINFIKQAKDAIIEKNYEKRYNLIGKAIAIITGLNSCLNFTEETEETAKALDEFYNMIDMRLLHIQSEDSLDSCDKIIVDLKKMRNAWADVATQISSSKKNDNISAAIMPSPQQEFAIAGGLENEVSQNSIQNLSKTEGQGELQIIA